MYTSLADDILDFFDSIPELALTAGVNLFNGNIPEIDKNGDPVTNAVLIVPASGPAPHEYLNTDSVEIDFWTVWDNTPAGYDMAKQISEMLHRKANYTLTNWYIYSSLVSGAILDVDQTQEGMKQHKLTVLFTCRLLAEVS